MRPFKDAVFVRGLSWGWSGGRKRSPWGDMQGSPAGFGLPGTGRGDGLCFRPEQILNKQASGFTDRNERTTLISEGLMKKNHQDFSSCKPGSVKSDACLVRICSGQKQSPSPRPVPGRPNRQESPAYRPRGFFSIRRSIPMTAPEQKPHL